jgi:hypothetical protein
VTIRAFKVACTNDCSPVITTRLQGNYYDVLVHGHEVYVGTDHGVAIVSLKCRGSCEPIGWLRSDANGPPGFGSLTGGPPNSYIPRLATGGDVVVEITREIETVCLTSDSPSCAAFGKFGSTMECSHVLIDCR